MKISRLAVTAILLAFGLMAQTAPKTKDAPKSAPPAAAEKGAAKKAAKEVPQSERCQAKTQDGDQCKRKASAGSKFCWQHGGKKKA